MSYVTQLESLKKLLEASKGSASRKVPCFWRVYLLIAKTLYVDMTYPLVKYPYQDSRGPLGDKNEHQSN